MIETNENNRFGLGPAPPLRMCWMVLVALCWYFIKLGYEFGDISQKSDY